MSNMLKDIDFIESVTLVKQIVTFRGFPAMERNAALIFFKYQWTFGSMIPLEPLGYAERVIAQNALNMTPGFLFRIDLLC